MERVTILHLLTIPWYRYNSGSSCWGLAHLHFEKAFFILFVVASLLLKVSPCCLDLYEGCGPIPLLYTEQQHPCNGGWIPYRVACSGREEEALSMCILVVAIRREYLWSPPALWLGNKGIILYKPVVTSSVMGHSREADCISASSGKEASSWLLPLRAQGNPKLHFSATIPIVLPFVISLRVSQLLVLSTINWTAVWTVPPNKNPTARKA